MYEAAGNVLGKLIGWVSIFGGPPVGLLMAAASDSQWAASGWMGAGFAGLVAGYLLVVFIPNMQKAHSEMLTAISQEHKEATRYATDGNAKAFSDAAERIVVSNDRMQMSHERSQRMLMKMFAKAAKLKLSDADTEFLDE